METLPEQRVAAVVLAAGASTRLGQAKQLVRVGGESLLRRTVRIAAEAGCFPVVVVLGFEAERMEAELEGMPAEVLVFPEWAEGMGSSLRCGVEAVRRSDPPSDAVMVLVCDQPRLSAEHLRALLTQHRTSAVPITASVYAGKTGVPAVFAREAFPELQGLQGDRGARNLIRRRADRVQGISWSDGSVDLDVQEDLRGVD
ncbi:MAG TPA: nucleotidyltransferase family protein [Acidobacteriaceae bacterium]|jgi:molybdenum cofactor cytidylyltransferase|nr:nucleotidyltransferase family protein [Acidobacteriaceae bacterium]